MNDKNTINFGGDISVEKVTPKDIKILSELGVDETKTEIMKFSAILVQAETNKNSDNVDSEGIADVCASLPLMPLDIDHVQDKVVGIFTKAYPVDNGQSAYVEALLYARRFPDDAEKVRNGAYKMSIEAWAKEAVCSVCGTVFNGSEEYCSHLQKRWYGSGAVRQLKGMRAFGGALTEIPAGSQTVIHHQSIHMIASEIDASTWDSKYVNSLPDSAFAVIEPAYKDGDVETKSCRHLPYKDVEGNIDLPHLRNALARMNQIIPVTKSISQEELRSKAKEVLERAAKKEKIGQYAQGKEGNGMEVKDTEDAVEVIATEESAEVIVAASDEIVIESEVVEAAAPVAEDPEEDKMPCEGNCEGECGNPDHKAVAAEVIESAVVEVVAEESVAEEVIVAEVVAEEVVEAAVSEETSTETVTASAQPICIRCSVSICANTTCASYATPLSIESELALVQQQVLERESALSMANESLASLQEANLALVEKLAAFEAKINEQSEKAAQELISSRMTTLADVLGAEKADAYKEKVAEMDHETFNLIIAAATSDDPRPGSLKGSMTLLSGSDIREVKKQEPRKSFVGIFSE